MLREMTAMAESAASGPCPDVPVPPAQRPRVLTRPAVHPAVRDAQRRLNRFHQLEVAAGRPGLERAPLAEDCMFGPATLAAVLSFQRTVFPGQPSEHDGKIGPKTWAKLDLVGLVPVPGPVAPLPLPVQTPPTVPTQPVEPLPVPLPIPIPETPAAQLCDAIARTAENEFNRWRPGGGAPLQETDPAASPILQAYYRDGVGVTVSASDLQSAAFQGTHPWSAVFVSWIMRTAGAGNAFAYSRAHQTYIRAARRNRLTANLANPFWAFPVTDVVPQVGDLVCASRANSGATYENIGDPQFRATHCDVVTAVNPGELRTIGGNVNQAVRAKRVRIAADGRLALDGNQSLFFALVRCSGPIPATVPAPPQPSPSPTPSTEVVDWSAVPADDRILQAMELLVNRYGYPVNGAAGIVGNLMAESGVMPSRIEGSAAATPMRARNFGGQVTDFTPEQIRDRNAATATGPRLPGVGLAQWTSANRRRGLFAHAFNGTVLDARILFSMDAQIDYLVTELGAAFRNVDAVLRNPGVGLNDAADEVVYRFEVPGSILENGQLLPRSDPRVQAVFGVRRGLAQRALQRFRDANPT